MPIYEYMCKKCGREIELMQKHQDPAPLCSCDKVNPVTMKRQISRCDFRLKGSGWYKTDYGSRIS